VELALVSRVALVPGLPSAGGVPSPQAVVIPSAPTRVRLSFQRLENQCGMRDLC